MRHNIADLGSDGELQHEIIVGIIQEGPPAETNSVLAAACSQEVQNIVNPARMIPEMLGLTVRHFLLLQKQRGGEMQPRTRVANEPQ